MSLFMEIGQSLWQVVSGADMVDFPLERSDDGSLTEGCRLRVVSGLRSFVNKKGWSMRRRAFVAISARGVSLRRLTLPPAPKEEFQRLIRLQIESDFPLPPEQLAWGWQPLGQSGGRQEVLVAAVKKEIVEPYAQILGACGISPVFTLAALARAVVSPPPAPSCAILYTGAGEPELLAFENGLPSFIRIPPSGAWAKPDALFVRKGINAIQGLQKTCAVDGTGPALVIQVGETRSTASGTDAWKWAAAAAVLALLLICFPYAEAVVLKPHLVRKLASVQADRARLPAIDRELDFLQYIKRTQPPYLDTIYLISKIAPSGTSFESFAMTRRGELTLRGKLPNPQQVTEFRSNLIQSAWFSSVVVDEQTPSPDRKVTVRMTAQVKPVDARKPLVVDVPSTNSAPTEPKK